MKSEISLDNGRASATLRFTYLVELVSILNRPSPKVQYK